MLVHEWNSHELVRRIGEHRARARRYRLFFHDTHHRSVTDPDAMAAYDLRHYDGVLAYGGVIRDLYREQRLGARARGPGTRRRTRASSGRMPRRERSRRPGLDRQLGRWRAHARNREFLIEPVKELGLKARVYGVRYPRAGARRAGRGGHRIRRLAAELSRARSVRAATA